MKSTDFMLILTIILVIKFISWTTVYMCYIVLEIALATKSTSGKWMIFRHRRIIDETWKMVAEATVAGKLGCSAKVVYAHIIRYKSTV